MIGTAERFEWRMTRFRVCGWERGLGAVQLVQKEESKIGCRGNRSVAPEGSDHAGERVYNLVRCRMDRLCDRPGLRPGPISG